MRPVDLIAVSIIITVCLLVLMVKFSAMWSGNTLNSDELDVIGHVVITMLAIVSLYVGHKIRTKDDDQR